MEEESVLFHSAVGDEDGEALCDTTIPSPDDTPRRKCAALEARVSPRTSVSRSCVADPQQFGTRIGVRRTQDFPRLPQNETQYNTAAFGHQHLPRHQNPPMTLLPSSTTFIYSNSTPTIFMSTLKNEYITPAVFNEWKFETITGL